jgi:hypothetical protein
MTIIQTQTTSFKAELYEGIHNLLLDTIKIALYNANADLTDSTTAYSASNEITGVGYVAGGKVMTGATINTSGFIAYVNFDNVVWTAPASFTARAALIYNSSKANRSIAILDFGADKTVIAGQSFTIVMPSNTATSALIRSSN